MKIKADRATLLKALAHVQSVVEKRNTIPILANVKIDAQDTRLTLTATDMEIAVVEEVPASSVADGALHRAGGDALRDRPQAAGGRGSRRWSRRAATRSSRCGPGAIRPASSCCRPTTSRR